MPPLTYKPLLHFLLKFLHRYFILQIAPPPNHGHATKIATWSFIETPTRSSSRSPWWSGNVRTKPVSTDQLRNSPTIATVSVSGINAIAHWTNPRSAWKTPPSTLWPTSVSQSWPLNFWRTIEAKADRCRTSLCTTVCNIIPMSTSRHGPGRGGAYSWDKMWDPAYKLPLRFRLVLRLQNGGRICGILQQWFYDRIPSGRPRYRSRIYVT